MHGFVEPIMNHKPMIFKISKCSGFFLVVVVCLIHVCIYIYIFVWFFDMTLTTGPLKKAMRKPWFCFEFFFCLLMLLLTMYKIQVSLGKDPSFLGERSKFPWGRSKPLSNELTVQIDLPDSQWTNCKDVQLARRLRGERT